MINPEPTVEEYKKFATVRVEALNHALRGLPQDRIRFHLCWGSWHGPHTTDIPMRDIVDLMLAVNAGAYSFEAGNVRHEHEWKVWQDVKLPDDKVILPGVVSHATNVVEHPELVAERILRFANLVGRERVIASTDCGLGGRVHSADRLGQARSAGRRAPRSPLASSGVEGNHEDQLRSHPDQPCRQPAASRRSDRRRGETAMMNLRWRQSSRRR